MSEHQVPAFVEAWARAEERAIEREAEELAGVERELRAAERERDELRRRVADLTVIEANLRDSCRIALANLEEERARVAELEAAPGGHRAAALITEIDGLAEDAVKEANRSEFTADRVKANARAAAFAEATTTIRAHFAAPSPRDLVVAEILALPEADPDHESRSEVDDAAIEVEQAATDLSQRLCGGAPLDTEARDTAKRIAALAIFIVLACDAEKGGA